MVLITETQVILGGRVLLVETKVILEGNVFFLIETQPILGRRVLLLETKVFLEGRGFSHGNPGNLRMEGFSHVKTGTFHVNL